MKSQYVTALLLALFLLACTATEQSTAGVVAESTIEIAEEDETEARSDNDSDEHPEAKPYNQRFNADSEVKLALARAKESGKRVIVVMGANWCHDSRGLAGWFERPRFADMLSAKYEIVYVNAGKPQKDKGLNIEVARRFGIESQENTPMVMVLSPQGERLNSEKDAKSWRNAASREADAIFDYFDKFEPSI